MTRDLVIRAAHLGPDGGAVVAVTPRSAGWDYSGLLVHELPPGASVTFELDDAEGVLVPLTGGVALRARTPEGDVVATLAGRPGVFAGATDTAYLPLGSVVTVTAPDAPARVALATARARSARPFAVLRAAEARVDLRGTGRASRRVVNYTIGTDVDVERILVCEVVTPGGNWSSYPPHKHDEHSDRPGQEERVLEEIYYFEIVDGPEAPGIGYHRVYGTPQRPIEVAAEVRTGDTVLVPHGYHGPCAAAPGYDMYYLNVMAGPADDGTWLSVDDPAHHWVRETWTDPVDPRLLTAPQPRTTTAHLRVPTSNQERA